MFWRCLAVRRVRVVSPVKPRSARWIQTLCDVGLEYVTLRPIRAPTLWAVKRKRVKLAARNSLARQTGHTALFLLDETGQRLHFTTSKNCCS